MHSEFKVIKDLDILIHGPVVDINIFPKPVLTTFLGFPIQVNISVCGLMLMDLLFETF